MARISGLIKRHDGSPAADAIIYIASATGVVDGVVYLHQPLRIAADENGEVDFLLVAADYRLMLEDKEYFFTVADSDLDLSEIFNSTPPASAGNSIEKLSGASAGNSIEKLSAAIKQLSGTSAANSVLIEKLSAASAASAGNSVLIEKLSVASAASAGNSVLIEKLLAASAASAGNSVLIEKLLAASAASAAISAGNSVLIEKLSAASAASAGNSVLIKKILAATAGNLALIEKLSAEEEEEEEESPEGGWVKLYKKPSIDLYSRTKVKIETNEHGLRCWSAGGWREVVVFRDLPISAGQTIYFSFKINSLFASNHLFGIGDFDFDFSKLSPAYKRPVIALNIYGRSAGFYRFFGKFGSKALRAQPLPSGYVTLKIAPLSKGMEVSLFETSAKNWDASDGIRFLKVEIPNVVVPEKCLPWWVVYGEDDYYLTGIKIS